MNWTLFATVGLLIASNCIMTFAWYGHLKLQQMGISAHWPLIAVILFSWGIAFFEYSFMVPANRIGYDQNGGPFSLIELKVLQEVITLTVFTLLSRFSSRTSTCTGTTMCRLPCWWLPFSLLS